MAEPVTVIGGSLAGLAAAARLAKLGHPVQLLERTDRLGGSWAARELAPGVLVDDAPAVLGFPAPWRDLFRKSGRPLEAELARAGVALVPADPSVFRFADGTELCLPSERGGQLTALQRAYGARVAASWQELIDRLERVWQTLRPLGLEEEFPAPGRFGRSPARSRAVRQRLSDRLTLADLAASAPHPQLELLLRSLAYRLGSPPTQVPALAAVQLWLDRTFGRWQLAPVDGAHLAGAGRSSLLIDALASRLALRKVSVQTEAEVSELPPQPVVSAVDPWTTARLAGTRPDPRWQPALGPAITHRLLAEPPGRVSEHVELLDDGVPVVSYRRPVADGSVLSVHDYTSARPQPRAGLAWAGFPGWVRRPPLRWPLPGVMQVGPWSVAGPGPAQQILTGALAAYAISGKHPV